MNYQEYHLPAKSFEGDDWPQAEDTPFIGLKLFSDQMIVAQVFEGKHAASDAVCDCFTHWIPIPKER